MSLRTSLIAEGDAGAGVSISTGTIFEAIVRIDTPVEIDYYRNGGILQTVLRKMVK